MFNCIGVIAEISARVPRQALSGEWGHKQSLKMLFISSFFFFFLNK